MPLPSKPLVMSETETNSPRTQANFAALVSLESAPRNLFRVTDEPAFVLRRSAWSETSLVAEFFTRSQGRVSAAARGASRPASRFRGLINPFYPLSVSIRGTGSVKNLVSARWLGGLQPLSGEGLLSGFYLNELLLRLTATEDPHPQLFDAYVQTLGQIASGKGVVVQRALRTFEVALLRECGWGQQLQPQETARACVFRDGQWVALEQAGLRRPEEPVYSAEVMRAVLTGDFSADAVLASARLALRQALAFYAGDKGFLTRRTLLAWQQL